MTTLPEQTRLAIDGLSLTAVVATLAGILPPIAAGLSIIWLCCQIWGWLANKRWRRDKTRP